MKITLACAAALLLAAQASASDKTLRDSFRAGLAATRPGEFHARARLVTRTIERLRHDHAVTPTGRTARRRALGGYLWALWGLRAQIAFVEHDSGEVAMAARDAARADRCWIHAAARLRAAGKALGVPVGLVNGF